MNRGRDFLSYSKCITLFAICWFGQVSAQTPANTPRPVKLYYNASCELTSPEKALFIRETNLDFENITFSGVCKDHLKSGQLMAEGYFDHGVNKGLHSDFYENGKVESTIEYADEGFILWELNSEKGEKQIDHGTGNFVIQCFSINLAPNSNMVTLSDGTVSGQFINGKREGVWTYYDKSSTKTDEETYLKGAFLKRTSFTKTGTQASDTKKPIIISLTGILTEAFSVDPTFVNLNQYFVQYLPAPDSTFRRWVTYPGGMKKLLLIIAQGLRTEIDDNLVIKMSVDENGKLGKIRTGLIGLGAEFTDEVKNILKKHETKFLPAMLNGKPYAYAMKIPIGNSPQWINYLETATDDDVNAYLDQLNSQQ